MGSPEDGDDEDEDEKPKSKKQKKSKDESDEEEDEKPKSSKKPAKKSKDESGDEEDEKPKKGAKKPASATTKSTKADDNASSILKNFTVDSLANLVFDVAAIETCLRETHRVDLKNLPLESLTKLQLDEAESALTEIAQQLSAGNNRDALKKLSNRFYTNVPMVDQAPIFDQDDLQLKLDLLAVLRDVESTMQIYEKQRSSKDFFAGSKVDLQILDESSKEFRAIYKYTKETQDKGPKLLSAFSVKPKDSSSFGDSIPNRKLLWAGSSPGEFHNAI